jgi:hypothetical protein
MRRQHRLARYVSGSLRGLEPPDLVTEPMGVVDVKGKGDVET